jgi:drug/metabolite transporter (DMT)-like permease
MARKGCLSLRDQATAILIALGVLWGSSFLFIKVLLDDISPLEIVTGRLVLGTAAVLPIVLYQRRALSRRPAVLGQLTIMALGANVIPFALIAWAEEHIDSGLAAVLNSTMPLFTALFAAAALSEERFTATRLLGLVSGFVGVVVLVGGDILDLHESSVQGQLAVIGAAACYGATAVYARLLLRSEDPVSLSAIQLIIATMIAIPFMFAVDGTPGYGSLGVKWLALIPLGALATGMAYVIYLWLVDNVGAVRASLVTYVVPVVALLLGWAVLDETLGLSTVIGGALIAGGIAAVMRGEAPSSQRTPVRIETTARGPR